MRDAAGKLAQRLHLLALPQLLLGLATFLHLLGKHFIGLRKRVGPGSEFAVGAAQRHLCQAQRGDDQRGEHDQDGEQGIAQHAPRYRLAVDLQVHRANPLPGKGDWGRHPDCPRAGLRHRSLGAGRSGAAPSITSHRPPGFVIDADPANLAVGA